MAAVVVSSAAVVLAAAREDDAHETSLSSRLDEVVAAGVSGVLAYVADETDAVRIARGAANRENGAEVGRRTGSGRGASQRPSWPRSSCS
jgi:hypothetical protein